MNLRKVAVLGGSLHLDLVLQPPQPRDLRTRLTLTVRKSIGVPSACLTSPDEYRGRSGGGAAACH